MVKTPGRHPVNHELRAVVYTACNLNTLARRHLLIPFEDRQFVLPAILRQQKPLFIGRAFLFADGTHIRPQIPHKNTVQVCSAPYPSTVRGVAWPAGPGASRTLR